MGACVIFAETASPPPQNHYGFQSSKLFAQRQSEPLPVVSATKRGLFVQPRRGSPKRVSYRAAVGLQQQFFVANNLIEITHQETRLTYRESGAYEQAAVSQMQRLDFTYDVEISEQRQLSGNESAEQIQALEAERSDFRDLTLESVAEGNPEVAGLHNGLTLALTLNAEHAIEDAFCAITINYVTAESRGKADKETRAALHAQYLGDIPGGVPHEVTLRFDLAPGEYDTSSYQLLLYRGDAQPLPTKDSKYLKELTPAEVLDLLER
ncbi:MAG: hypothetical protein SynsKO_06840 [Synoicihabitans sp.]